MFKSERLFKGIFCIVLLCFSGLHTLNAQVDCSKKELITVEDAEKIAIEKVKPKPGFSLKKSRSLISREGLCVYAFDYSMHKFEFGTNGKNKQTIINQQVLINAETGKIISNRKEKKKGFKEPKY